MGIEIERFRHLIPALRAFDTKRYDVIILNPVVAPGLVAEQQNKGMVYAPGQYDNDPRIKEIMEEYQGRNKNPDYWKLAMYTIEVAKRSTSPNARTPILVVGFYNEEGDALFPNAEQTARAAGAIDYYNLGRRERYEQMIKDIIRLTT